MARIQALSQTILPLIMDPAGFDLAALFGGVLPLQAVADPAGGGHLVRLALPGDTPGLLLELRVEAASFAGGDLVGGRVVSGSLTQDGVLQLRLSGLGLAVADLIGALETPADAADDRALLTGLLAGHDRLAGGAAGDRLAGLAGRDRLEGRAGADSLFGGDGNDLVLGGAGADLMQGGIGADRLRGGAGADTLTGGAGADVFVLASGSGRDRVTDFRDGIDRLLIEGGTLDDLVILARNGNVVLRLGQSELVLEGVEPTRIGAEDFLFV